MTVYCYRCGKQFVNKKALFGHRKSCPILQCIKLGALPEDFFLRRAQYEAGLRDKPPKMPGKRGEF